MFEDIMSQIVNQYNPDKVLLFGSQSSGYATENSDIDLCVVVETDNKRKLLADMYYSIESEKPIDFLLYTPKEWFECIKDKTSFAFKLNKEGVVLYGR